MSRVPFLRRALLLSLCLSVALASSVRAAEDQDNSTPTGWKWFYGQTTSSLSSQLAAGYRLVDLEVESGSPLRFTAAMVQNTGSYAKGWWWYHGLSFGDIGTLVSQNDARLIDIEPYEVSGVTRYAVVMVSNTGADAKAWWYLSTTNVADISATISNNNARVVDLEETVLQGTTWYTAILISNTGADAKGWYWWLGASSSFLSSEIASKGLRLVDLERRSNGTYNAVLVKNTEGMHWWWYLGQSAAGLTAAIDQTGSRIQSVQRVGGLFYAVLHNNSNDLTTYVGDILRNGTDGVSGLYLKQVNGSVRAALQERFVFEPASTIKTLMNVHAFRQIEAGSASLTENLTVWTGIQGNSCPIYTGPVTEDLSKVLSDMMWYSDNNRTMAVRDRFGAGNINNTAAILGMTDTAIIHTLGCGGPPPNSLTLYDGGQLHERVANGYLGNSRDDFYAHMLTGVSEYGGDRLGQIIDAEGAALGLDAFLVEDFKSLMGMAYKGGSYGYGNPLDYYWSVLTWSRIPFLSHGSLAPKEYVSGIFIHDASSSAGIGSTMDLAAAELLRDEIRAALQTWADHDDAWANLGGGAPGTTSMQLSGQGTLAAGTLATTNMTGALPFAPATYVVGFSLLQAPFKGGVWGPFPDVLFAGIDTGSDGAVSMPAVWPAGLPSGWDFYVQWWQADAGAPAGFAGSNTLRGTTP